jgi:hypothetical protein
MTLFSGSCIAFRLNFGVRDLLMVAFTAKVMAVTLTGVHCVWLPKGEVLTGVLGVAHSLLTSDVFLIPELVPVDFNARFTDARVGEAPCSFPSRVIWRTLASLAIRLGR